MRRYRGIRFAYNEDANKISKEINALANDLRKDWSYVNGDLYKRILRLMSDNKNDKNLELAFKYWQNAVKKNLPELVGNLDYAAKIFQLFSER